MYNIALWSMLALTSGAEAKHCDKGQPCGNSCISWDKTCRIGTSYTPKPSTSRASPSSISTTAASPSSSRSTSVSSTSVPGQYGYGYTVKATEPSKIYVSGSDGVFSCEVAATKGCSDLKSDLAFIVQTPLLDGVGSGITVYYGPNNRGSCFIQSCIQSALSALPVSVPVSEIPSPSGVSTSESTQTVKSKKNPTSTVNETHPTEYPSTKESDNAAITPTAAMTSSTDSSSGLLFLPFGFGVVAVGLLLYATKAKSEEATRAQQQQDAKRREETARLHAEEVARQKAREAALLRQAEEERLRKEQEQQEAPHKLVLWLLKYIATADRRFSDGEQDMILRYIKSHFASGREAPIGVWVKELSIDPLKLDGVLAPFKDMNEETRKNLFQLLQEMSTADGKATKAEKERLMLIQKGLGLSHSS